MSSPTPRRPSHIELDEDDEPEPKGPNLFVLYTVLALGLLAAMGFAAMVVYPFYVRR
jgi:hypothetical protein